MDNLEGFEMIGLRVFVLIMVFILAVFTFHFIAKDMNEPEYIQFEDCDWRYKFVVEDFPCGDSFYVTEENELVIGLLPIRLNGVTCMDVMYKVNESRPCGGQP